jgi:hypothetical protein
LRAEGFFCGSSEILYGGLGIEKVWFLKNKKNFRDDYFQFLVIKTLETDRIRIGVQPKTLDPDQMNTDPKH